MYQVPSTSFELAGIIILEGQMAAAVCIPFLKINLKLEHFRPFHLKIWFLAATVAKRLAF